MPGEAGQSQERGAQVWEDVLAPYGSPLPASSVPCWGCSSLRMDADKGCAPLLPPLPSPELPQLLGTSISPPALPCQPCRVTGEGNRLSMARGDYPGYNRGCGISGAHGSTAVLRDRCGAQFSTLFPRGDNLQPDKPTARALPPPKFGLV